MNMIRCILLCMIMVNCILCMRSLKEAERELNKLKDGLEDYQTSINDMKNKLYEILKEDTIE